MVLRASALLSLMMCGLCQAADFTLTSPTLQEGGSLPLDHVQCGGANASPELQWRNPPPGTRSFAVTVFDPDAPTLSGWWHWQIYNIPASVTALPANAGNPASGLAPVGSVHNVNDGGKSGFMGACPPKGDKAHRYIFSVYALPDDVLKVPAAASNAMIGFNLVRRALAKASITVSYGRD